jgi:hypothetical protein
MNLVVGIYPVKFHIIRRALSQKRFGSLASYLAVVRVYIIPQPGPPREDL